MANSPYPSGGTVAAEPAPIDFDWASTALSHHRHARRRQDRSTVELTV
jgi:hypothetical protein